MSKRFTLEFVCDMDLRSLAAEAIAKVCIQSRGLERKIRVISSGLDANLYIEPDKNPDVDVSNATDGSHAIDDSHAIDNSHAINVENYTKRGIASEDLNGWTAEKIAYVFNAGRGAIGRDDMFDWKRFNDSKPANNMYRYYMISHARDMLRLMRELEKNYLIAKLYNYPIQFNENLPQTAARDDVNLVIGFSNVNDLRIRKLYEGTPYSPMITTLGLYAEHGVSFESVLGKIKKSDSDQLLENIKSAIPRVIDAVTKDYLDVSILYSPLQ
ncbi:MAG: hypothetical protein ABIG89_06960 [Candidatus Woesearchaeota archaeon]